jgi:lysophospholipase L1-like esterase
MDANEPLDLIFIGDSLMEYFDWAARLPFHRVANLGVSGETVSWLLERILRVTGAHPKADVVFIQSGINDVSMDETSIAGPYRAVVDALRAAYPDARIVVTSLLPTLLPWLKPEVIDLLNSRLRSMASEAGQSVDFLDVHREFMAHGNLADLLMPDGIHVSEHGYEVWAEMVEQYLNTSL